MFRSLPLVAITVAIASASAHAHIVPQYNIPGLCAMDRMQDYRACITSEDTALKNLTTAVTLLAPDADIRHCLDMRFPSEAETCVLQWQMRREEQARHQKALAEVTPAGAALPRIDVDAGCRSRAKDSKASQTTYDDCFQAEQQAYDRLKAYWSKLPADIVARCAPLGSQNYYLVEICANASLSALSKQLSIQKRDFKY